MEKDQYPNLGAHKEIHHVFVNDMTALLQSLNNAERFEISDESLNMIARWLDNHILTEDKDYALYAARRALSPAEDRGARPA